MAYGSYTQPGPLPQPKVSPALQHIRIAWGALGNPNVMLHAKTIKSVYPGVGTRHQYF